MLCGSYHTRVRCIAEAHMKKKYKDITSPLSGSLEFSPHVLMIWSLLRLIYLLHITSEVIKCLVSLWHLITCINYLLPHS